MGYLLLENHQGCYVCRWFWNNSTIPKKRWIKSLRSGRNTVDAPSSLPLPCANVSLTNLADLGLGGDDCMGIELELAAKKTYLSRFPLLGLKELDHFVVQADHILLHGSHLLQH